MSQNFELKDCETAEEMEENFLKYAEALPEGYTHAGIATHVNGSSALYVAGPGVPAMIWNGKGFVRLIRDETKPTN